MSFSVYLKKMTENPGKTAEPPTKIHKSTIPTAKISGIRSWVLGLRFFESKLKTLDSNVAEPFKVPPLSGMLKYVNHDGSSGTSTMLLRSSLLRKLRRSVEEVVEAKKSLQGSILIWDDLISEFIYGSRASATDLDLRSIGNVDCSPVAEPFKVPPLSGTLEYANNDGRLKPPATSLKSNLSNPASTSFQSGSLDVFRTLNLELRTSNSSTTLNFGPWTTFNPTNPINSMNATLHPSPFTLTKCLLFCDIAPLKWGFPELALSSDGAQVISKITF